MTLQDLVEKTIQAQEDRTNTNFEDITHRGLPVKAIVEFGDFRNAKRDFNIKDNTLSDQISFINVKISVIDNGDSMVYKSVDYTIKHFMPIGNGRYNIHASKAERVGRY